MESQKIIVVGLSLMGLVSLASGCASGRTASRRAPETQPATERHQVYFEFNQSGVRSEDKSLLDRIASRLQGDAKAVAILEGHADQVGEAAFNEILAESRARSVRVYLRDQGADPRRLTVLSKGEREPIVTGWGRTALQPNRRVDILMTLTGGPRD